MTTYDELTIDGFRPEHDTSHEWADYPLVLKRWDQFSMGSVLYGLFVVRPTGAIYRVTESVENFDLPDFMLTVNRRASAVRDLLRQ